MSSTVTEPAMSASSPQAPLEEDQATEQRKSERSPGSRGKKAKRKKPRSASEDEAVSVFDKVYNKPGRVQVFPHFVQSKLTLYKRVTPARPPPPAHKVSGPQGSSKQKPPTTLSDSCKEKPPGLDTESQQLEEEEGETPPDGKQQGASQDQPAAKPSPAFPQAASAADPPSGKEEQRGPTKTKEKKIKDLKAFVLDEEKLTKPDVLEKLEAEDCEFLVLQRTKAALEEITKPDDPPVFLLHNQDLNAGEKDAIVLHPHLGVLLLEVKAVSNTRAFSRFDEATAQLLHAQEYVQKEMGDLLEKDAVLLTIALPKLRPEDSSTIRLSAQEPLWSKQTPDVMTEETPTEHSPHLPTDSPPATSPPPPAQAGDVIPKPSTSQTSTTSMTSPPGGKKGGSKGKKSGGAGGGSDKKVKEGALLRDHPEVHLLCGSTAEVYTDWVRQLQQHRASSSHAFRGSTDQERLDNFKRACIRRCSVPALRPGQSVKASSTLHDKWLLTEEQLRVRDSQAQLLHLSGPCGSGKTVLLVERGRRWLREGRRLALVVWSGLQDVLLRHLTQSVCGEKADEDRVSTHTHHTDLLERLNTASTEDPVYVILDEAASPADYYPLLLDHVRAGRVRGLWTAHTRPLPDELETALQREGGSTVQLSLCLRCPPHVMAWANSLRQEEEPPLLPPPVPVTRELGVEVELISHYHHPQSLYQSWDTCPSCRESVETFFSSLGLLGGSTRSELSWRDVVVIITSGWEDREPVAEWLRGLGLPALAETETWRYPTPVLLPGVPPQSPDQAEREAMRSRVLSGEDSQGHPALHVVWWLDFRGLERGVVLLWHVDRDWQRQELWDSRLSRYHYSWFQAASRCQGRLVVMATTPSPLLLALSPPPLELSQVIREVLSHHSHYSPGALPYWQCDQCGQGLLQSLGLPVGSSPEPGFWKNIVIAVVGGSSHGSQAAEWLRGLGLPAVFEEPEKPWWGAKYNQAKVEAWQERIKAGKDGKGQDALHVVQELHFLIPPVPLVVLVHHDTDDNDPGLQDQKKRDSRMQWHRYCWSQVLSHSQEVILLATTPSPLLALLKSPADTAGQSPPPSSGPGVTSDPPAQPACPVSSSSEPPSQQ